MVAVAETTDIPRYVELAKVAQEFLHSQGLTQWVPAAHPGFLPSIEAKVERRSLHKVTIGSESVAFFDFSFHASEWWPDRIERAGYISGIVVARSSRGQGIGSILLQWAEARVRDGDAPYLRLDCHAENRWLCDYYRAKGFSEVARIEQYPGYIGALFQKTVADAA
jgi:ribosomal protein S18 acetylase RimI-like enzyme